MAKIKLKSSGEIILRNGKPSCADCDALANWSEWTPQASQICSGVSFTQSRFDLNACVGDQTRQATGTKDCSSPAAEPIGEI